MGLGGGGLEDAEVPAESSEEIIPNIRDLAWRLFRLHMEVERAEGVLVECLAECDRMAEAFGETGAAVKKSRGAEGARTGRLRWRVQALCTASPSAATGAVSHVLENHIAVVESVVHLGAASWVLLRAALAWTACADRDEQRLYQSAR